MTVLKEKTFEHYIKWSYSIRNWINIYYLGLTKSWCIDRKKYEDKEKALILFH